MKMIKMALLGGAALAVTAGVARADDLADLKAQVEALNARVAQMEAAPSVPAGYSLLSIGEGYAHIVPGMTREEQADFSGPVTTVSVLPTADAPAGAVIEWNGLARAMLGYVNVDEGDDEDDDVSLYSRGRLNMTARTDTAVGEVGVRLRLEGNSQFNNSVDVDLPVEMEIAWGWWAMTPELTLGGGYNGSLSAVGFGYDGVCTCHFVDAANVYEQEGDANQMRLSYASGPMSVGIAIEDGTAGSGELAFDREGLRFAGEVAYAGDTFSGEISGVYAASTAGNSDDNDDGYNIGAGIGFSLDPVSLSFAGGVGNTAQSSGVDDDYFYINGHASLSLSDEIHVEVGAGYKDYEDGDRTIAAVMGGAYYTPVDQLTIGLEAEYFNEDVDGADDIDTFLLGLVTVYSF